MPTLFGQDDMPITGYNTGVGISPLTGQASAFKAALQQQYANTIVPGGLVQMWQPGSPLPTIQPYTPPTNFGPPVYVPPSETLPPPVKPPPRFLGPPLREPPPSPSPGPMRVWHPRRMPRPVVRRPFAPRLAPRPVASAPVGELCPIAGYVRRPIPGVAEEQIFRCTAGQPVVIDAGIREAGRAEAAARYGMHGLDGFDLSTVSDSPWLWIAGAAALYYFFIKKR